MHQERRTTKDRFPGRIIRPKLVLMDNASLVLKQPVWIVISKEKKVNNDVTYL